MQTLKQKILILTLAIVITACSDDGKIISSTKDGEELKEENPLIGEWYEFTIGGIFNSNRTVIFAKTHLTSFSVQYPEWLQYKNIEYNILSDDTIQFNGLPVSFFPYDHPSGGEHKTKFIIVNDTLTIEHFTFGAIAVPYPDNFAPIYLIRCKEKNHNE